MCKLENNQRLKSHLPENSERFLVRGHVFCPCGWRISCINDKRYGRGEADAIPLYHCKHARISKDRPFPIFNANAYEVDEWAWGECCKVFELLDGIHLDLQRALKDEVNNLFPARSVDEKAKALAQEITEIERTQSEHAEGSYLHKLIGGDIAKKKADLSRFLEEAEKATPLQDISTVYEASIDRFIEFLRTKQGNYHNATYQDKRNALEVLGVRVTLSRVEGELVKSISFSPIVSGVSCI
jgi:hypothetical protein